MPLPQIASLMRAMTLAALIATAVAAGAAARDDDREHRDAMRRAVEAGDAMPLSDILVKVRGRIAGDVTGVEIERARGRWLYEFRVIRRDGRVLDVYVDARSGEIERIEEK